MNLFIVFVAIGSAVSSSESDLWFTTITEAIVSLSYQRYHWRGHRDNNVERNTKWDYNSECTESESKIINLLRPRKIYGYNRTWMMPCQNVLCRVIFRACLLTPREQNQSKEYLVEWKKGEESSSAMVRKSYGKKDFPEIMVLVVLILLVNWIAHKIWGRW